MTHLHHVGHGEGEALSPGGVQKRGRGGAVGLGGVGGREVEREVERSASERGVGAVCLGRDRAQGMGEIGEYGLC